MPEKNILKNNCFFLLWLAVIIFVTACTSGKNTTDADHSLSADHLYVHTVKWPHETMAKIALWYTGKSDNWIEISRLNRNCDPSRLSKNCQINIPRNLMIKFSPMPKKFALTCLNKKSRQNKEKKVVTKQHAAVNEDQTEDIPLFGPK